jgi:hypothetical protein
MVSRIIKLEFLKIVRNKQSYLLLAISIFLGIIIIANFFSIVRMRFGSWVHLPNNIEKTFTDFVFIQTSMYLFYWDCFISYFLVLFYMLNEVSFYKMIPLRISSSYYIKVFSIRFFFLILMMMLAKAFLIWFINNQSLAHKVIYIQNFTFFGLCKFIVFEFFSGIFLLSIFFLLFDILRQKVAFFTLGSLVLLLVFKKIDVKLINLMFAENFNSLAVDFTYKLFFVSFFAMLFYSVLLFIRKTYVKI